jgi:hypothetical protein
MFRHPLAECTVQGGDPCLRLPVSVEGHSKDRRLLSALAAYAPDAGDAEAAEKTGSACRNRTS